MTNIRDQLSELTQAFYEDGSQAEADNQAGDGSIRGSELEIKAHRLEEALAIDLEQAVAAMRRAIDLSCYEADSEFFRTCRYCGEQLRVLEGGRLSHITHKPGCPVMDLAEAIIIMGRKVE